MSHGYEIIACPKCREQLDPEDGGHEHDGIYYHGAHVGVVPTWGDSDLADMAASVASTEAAHAARLEREAADRAELARMEAEWRATATPEQVEHYERARAQAAEIRMSLNDTIKRAYGSPRLLGQLHDESPLLAALPGRQAVVPILQGDGQIKLEPAPDDWQAKRDARVRDEAEETVARFEKHGPAAVGFAALREARRRLAELDSRP